ncbi:hypothetical protein NA57DRAFT_50575 [Rhizodiscina lignyota]|uniref:Uncharacterized protein n=1 Tax=Rhizodiscina lignyota TaxID=1504668 RepID=A0A9P4MAW9_9PEZI|nr:hypothetical protein NA57DRAFT_50575 [Rhizodiscina lignyota]
MAPIHYALAKRNTTAETAGVAILSIGIAVLAIPMLLILATAIAIFCSDCWHIMVKNRSRYLEREKLRAKWNRAAYKERRRQDIITPIVRRLVEEKDYSEEKWFKLLQLTQRTYFPSRRHIHHSAITSLCSLWERAIWKIFRTGYYKEPWLVDVDEWNSAIDHAQGEPEDHLEEYLETLDFVPPRPDLVGDSSLTISTISTSASNLSGSSNDTRTYAIGGSEKGVQNVPGTSLLIARV